MSVLTGQSPARLQITDVRNAGQTDHQFFETYYNGRPLTPPLPRRRIPDSMTTLAERIKQGNPNYATAFFGK